MNAYELGRAYSAFLDDDTIRVLLFVLGDDSLLLLRTERGVICVERDFSRYDAHNNLDVVDLELETYTWMNAPREVLRLMASMRKAQGRTTKGIKYSVEGTRRSGDPNTSCGNSYQNALMTLFSSQQADLHNDPTPAAVNLADDILRRLGFAPETILHDSYRLGSFCSSLFWPALADGNPVYVLGPKIGRTITKLFWNTTTIDDKEWARAVAVGLQTDVSHIPILRVAVQTVIDLTEGVRTIVLPDDHKFHLLRPVQMDVAVWHFVSELYGVNPSQVLDVEVAIQSIRRLPARIDHPILNHMIEVDLKPEYRMTPDDGHCPMQVGTVHQTGLVMYLWNVCVEAPLLEEALKHLPTVKKVPIGPIITALIVAFEWHRAYRERDMIGFWGYIPTAAMHVGAHLLPYWKGVSLHFAWNAYVVAVHAFAGITSFDWRSALSLIRKLMEV
jgi:hypothetical protein